MSVGEWIALGIMAALLVCVGIVWWLEKRDQELRP